MLKTVKFDIDSVLSEKITAQAARKNISVDQLLTDAVELYLAAAKENEWRAGFEAMGRDPETNDVDDLLPAAREVVFGD